MDGRGACCECLDGGREELEARLPGAGEPERDRDVVLSSLRRCILIFSSNCSEIAVGLNSSCSDLRGGGGGGGALRGGGGPLKSPMTIRSCTLFS